MMRVQLLCTVAHGKVVTKWELCKSFLLQTSWCRWNWHSGFLNLPLQKYNTGRWEWKEDFDQHYSKYKNSHTRKSGLFGRHARMWKTYSVSSHDSFLSQIRKDAGTLFRANVLQQKKEHWQLLPFYMASLQKRHCPKPNLLLARRCARNESLRQSVDCTELASLEVAGSWY